MLKKTLKNFDVTSKVSLGLALGLVLLVIDALHLYGGQPLPERVFKIGEFIAGVIVMFGLADVADLEKKNLIDRLKQLVNNTPILGTVIAFVNAALNMIPNFAELLPAGLENALYGLAAALVALGLRQQTGEARNNLKPVDPMVLAKSKYKVFAK